MPTPSALCQRRKLLDPDIFKRINRLFLSSFDNFTSINGYRILAQDGSVINIPFKNDDTRIAYNCLGVSCCQYHINALYDCLNHTFLDWSIGQGLEIEYYICSMMMYRSNSKVMQKTEVTSDHFCPLHNIG